MATKRIVADTLKRTSSRYQTLIQQMADGQNANVSMSWAAERNLMFLYAYSHLQVQFPFRDVRLPQ